MDKPERVDLVFPRSGQQLYVHVPSQVAQAMSLVRQQERAAVREQAVYLPHYTSGDDRSFNA